MTHEPRVPIAVVVIEALELLLVLLEGLVLELAAPEEALGVGLELLAQLLVREGAGADELDPRDPDLLALADHELEIDAMAPRHGVGHGVDGDPSVPLVVVVAHQRVHLRRGVGGRIGLAGMEEQLLLEVRRVLVAVAEEFDLRDPRALLHVDLQVDDIVVREPVHVHVVEQPECEELANPAAHRLLGVPAPARDFERPHDARAVGDDIAHHAHVADPRRRGLLARSALDRGIRGCRRLGGRRHREQHQQEEERGLNSWESRAPPQARRQAPDQR
jgi:hypothetical protein